MALSQQHEASDKEKLLTAFSAFIYKNRVFLITLLVVLVLGLITLGVILSIRQSQAEKGAALAESILETYESWAGESDETVKEELKQKIIDQAGSLTGDYPKTFAAQRALFTLAELYFNDKAYAEAAENYMKLAREYPSSYLAPVALSGASAAYENLQDLEASLAAAESIISSYSASLEAPRAFFTAGRLKERLEDPEGALALYSDLSGKFPESSWTKLAQDRIIVLEPVE
ncbi:MAG: tetratricopeptide repeat protein [Spirochaetales bacterium]|nr:tetratricopeptide repeat protein [Spirochaetales bacterium]